MKIETTVVIVKPDAVNRYLVGEILKRIEQKGLKIIGMKMVHLSDKILDEHYAHHVHKSFYPGLKAFMQHSPSIVIALEGLNAVQVVRMLAGETHGAKAVPGTIRGDLSLSNQSNVLHASDSVEAAEVELKRFFKKDELYTYERIDSEILYAEDERGA